MQSQQRILHIIEPIILIVVIIFAWQIASTYKLINATFFPPPSTIATAFVKLIANHTLTNDLQTSLFRMLSGFVIGASIGVIAGLAIGWSRTLYRLLDPLISATFPIPKIAILPLMLVLLGIGSLPIIAVVAIECMYAVTFNTYTGVRSVDRTLLRMSVNLGSSTWQQVRKVVLPSVLPMIFTGFRISLGVSLIVDIAAEFVVGSSGIGYRLWLSWEIFDINQMYAALILVFLLGLLFTYPLMYIQRKLMPWQQVTP